MRFIMHVTTWGYIWLNELFTNKNLITTTKSNISIAIRM